MNPASNEFVEANILVRRIHLDFDTQLIKECDQASLWEAAETYTGNTVRSNSVVHLTVRSRTHPSLQEFDGKLYALFGESIKTYIESNPYASSIRGDQGYQVLRYAPGERFDEHIDDGGLGKDRKVSAILFLNGDFTGGKLSFPRQKIEIQPEPGMVVLFPSSFAYPHRADPVITGTRYAVVTWFI